MKGKWVMVTAGSAGGKDRAVDKEEIKERYRCLGRVERVFLTEVYDVCNNLNPDIFENFFKLDGLPEKDFFEITDFLYHNGCFILLRQMMMNYPERFMHPDLLVSMNIEIRDGLEKRLDRFLKGLAFLYPYLDAGLFCAPGRK